MTWAASSLTPTWSASVGNATPVNSLSNRLQPVTQWKSWRCVSVGRSVNSSNEKEPSSSTAPHTSRLQFSRATLGVPDFESTGNFSVRRCPGGSRSPSNSSWRSVTSSTLMREATHRAYLCLTTKPSCAASGGALVVREREALSSPRKTGEASLPVALGDSARAVVCLAGRYWSGSWFYRTAAGRSADTGRSRVTPGDGRSAGRQRSPQLFRRITGRPAGNERASGAVRLDRHN